MRARKLSTEGRREIEDVARARYVLPTDKELERKHGVSRAYIWKLMKAVREKLVGESIVSRETNMRDNPTPPVGRSP